MRNHSLIAALVATGLLAGHTAGQSALAEDAAWQPMAGDELAMNRGGTDTHQDPAQIVAQGNNSELTGTNTDNTVLNSGTWNTGDVMGTAVTGNRGITAVLQNTGDIVNMNYSTSVNIFLQ